MHFIAQNLKFLRKEKQWTQEEFARQMGVNRSVIGAYEEGRADPRISFLQQLCDKFQLSIDQLVNVTLDKSNLQKRADLEGSSLRVLPITIDLNSGKETARLVPVKAAAGYLDGFGDVEFIEKLPVFQMPFPELSVEKTYRIFQIKGESMLPVLPNSYVICSYTQDWNNIKNDDRYVVVSKNDGIVFKRILNSVTKGFLTLKSDNLEYAPYDLSISDVVEVWKAEGITHFGFQNESQALQGLLFKELQDIKSELSDLKNKI
jgi:transcriptional regulator with XRE-family HTH domain